MIVGDMIHQHIPLPFSFYEGSLKQLAGNDRYQLALNVYERFVADWLEPSPVTLSCLISFVAEVGNMRRAAGFFEQTVIDLDSVVPCLHGARSCRG